MNNSSSNILALYYKHSQSEAKLEKSQRNSFSRTHSPRNGFSEIFKYDTMT